jgi:hypothetical protein
VEVFWETFFAAGDLSLFLEFPDFFVFPDFLAEPLF